MTATQSDTIHTIDGHYHFPGRAAAFLIADRDEAAFVDRCIDAILLSGLAMYLSGSSRPC